MKNFSFYSLGCKLNFSEASSIAGDMKKAGYIQVDSTESPNICFINTCTVTQSADRKSKQAIKRIIKKYPEAFVVVTGCLAQISVEELAKIDGVDLILGNNEKFDILKYLDKVIKNKAPEIFNENIMGQDEFNPSFSLSDRTRSFFKVQDGCDYKCSYCIIPHARGKSRNISIKNTLSIAKNITKSDVKEIVLSGVNVGDFGKSTNERFVDLIKALDELSGIERFRISSIEPDLLTDEIVDFIAKSKSFVPHFHIPLQSGSGRILKLMKRRYGVSTFTNRINIIHSIMPLACIGVDIITGFPGETDEDFQETYEYLKLIDISYIHVFPYSERNNTYSVKMHPKINSEKIKKRKKILQYLSEEKKKKFYKKNIGQTANVLFESGELSGGLTGFTTNYIKVEIPYDKGKLNTIMSVKLKGIIENGNMSCEFL
ncbi:tRNA (N(6)-L-threonylcarbamoyladenosine(37)-C(2))-methylthiotransferase MtaB [Bacteroidota bacterium]